MPFIESIIKSLIDPLSFSFAIIVIAILIKNIHAKKAKYLLVFGVSWSVTFSQPFVADLILYPLEYYFPQKIITQSKQKTSKATHIHVLACYYDGRETRPFVSRWEECSHQRMIEAVRLHNQYRIPIVLTGGGTPKHADNTHAWYAKQYLLSVGVSRDQIIMIEKGKNTRTEVEGIISVLDPENLIVVSSATHIYRINKIYSNQGINPFFFPVDHQTSGLLAPYLSLPKSSALEATRRAFYEYVAILKDYILN